jgi:fumarate hydratase class II
MVVLCVQLVQEQVKLMTRMKLIFKDKCNLEKLDPMPFQVNQQVEKHLLLLRNVLLSHIYLTKTKKTSKHFHKEKQTFKKICSAPSLFQE